MDFSVNTEIIEIILFKTAYRVQFFQTNYYITIQTNKPQSLQVIGVFILKKKPKTPQIIYLLPQVDLSDVPDMTFSFFTAHLF